MSRIWVESSHFKVFVNVQQKTGKYAQRLVTLHMWNLFCWKFLWSMYMQCWICYRLQITVPRCPQARKGNLCLADGWRSTLITAGNTVEAINARMDFPSLHTARAFVSFQTIHCRLFLCLLKLTVFGETCSFCCLWGSWRELLLRVFLWQTTWPHGST